MISGCVLALCWYEVGMFWYSFGTCLVLVWFWFGVGIVFGMVLIWRWYGLLFFGMVLVCVGMVLVWF